MGPVTLRIIDILSDLLQVPDVIYLGDCLPLRVAAECLAVGLRIYPADCFESELGCCSTTVHLLFPCCLPFPYDHQSTASLPTICPVLVAPPPECIQRHCSVQLCL